MTADIEAQYIDDRNGGGGAGRRSKQATDLFPVRIATETISIYQKRISFFSCSENRLGRDRMFESKANEEGSERFKCIKLR